MAGSLASAAPAQIVFGNVAVFPSADTQAFIAEAIAAAAAAPHSSPAEPAAPYPGRALATQLEERLFAAESLLRTLADLLPGHFGASAEVGSDAICEAMAMVLDELAAADAAIVPGLPVDSATLEDAKTALCRARGLVSCWGSLADAGKAGAMLKLDADAWSAALDQTLSLLKTAARAARPARGHA